MVETVHKITADRIDLDRGPAGRQVGEHDSPAGGIIAIGMHALEFVERLARSRIRIDVHTLAVAINIRLGPGRGSRPGRQERRGRITLDTGPGQNRVTGGFDHAVIRRGHGIEVEKSVVNFGVDIFIKPCRSLGRNILSRTSVPGQGPVERIEHGRIRLPPHQRLHSGPHNAVNVANRRHVVATAMNPHCERRAHICGQTFIPGIIKTAGTVDNAIETGIGSQGNRIENRHAALGSLPVEQVIQIVLRQHRP